MDYLPNGSAGESDIVTGTGIAVGTDAAGSTGAAASTERSTGTVDAAGTAEVEVTAAKAALRRASRARREAIPLVERSEWSQRICVHLVGQFGSNAVVMSYLAIRSEVDLGSLGDVHSGVIVVPRVEGKNLVAVEWRQRDELMVSTFGVPEPLGPGIDPSLIDVVCVPGLAFDRAGRRLGYGAGFYDRFLPRLRPDALVVAVGFEIQIVDRVPVDDHDWPVDLVITERGIVGGTSASNHS